MAKVKLTKNELKAQRDALKRYERYLPTLQLKKQQLQAEVRAVEHKLDEVTQKEIELQRVREDKQRPPILVPPLYEKGEKQ